MKIQVQAVMQTSFITHNDMYYIVFGEGNETYAINVGKKTYDKVKEMTEPNTTKKEDKK